MGHTNLSSHQRMTKEIEKQTALQSEREALRQAIKFRDAAQHELLELADIEGTTRQDAEATASELSRTVSVRVLALPLPAGETLEPGVAKTKARLDQLRQKLELLPGLEARHQALLSESDCKLRDATLSLRTAARREAQAATTALRQRLTSELRPTCGNDPGRVRTASEAVIAQCESLLWERAFGCSPSGEPLAAAKAMLGQVERFLAGETLAQRKATA
jgi:hypothetical protein